MKGLLRKDWYIAAKNCRLQFGVIALMIVISVFIDSGMAYLFYPVLFAGILPVSVLAAEEKSGWQRYADTLPVSRGMIVTEKYIAALVAVGGTVALMGLVWSARTLLTGDRDWYGLLRILAQLCCFGIVYPAVTLPPMFRFGAEKGRVVTMVIGVIAAIGIVMLEIKASEIGQPDLAGAMGWHVPALALIAAALLLASWGLAVNFYKTREL